MAGLDAVAAFVCVVRRARARRAMEGPSSVWVAIAVTVIASTSCSVGKALQKEATRSLPRFSSERKVVAQYLQSRTWLAGVLADVAGGVLQVVAFALAPVRVWGLA